ncbi:kelch domain-containing protein 4-like isoform X1 [Hylaeus anthracinus]|uniref:kelch domain-containing protein 4-like isoform X1 n=2 Tax=Hylaeus anthracinus TaxID=313031 RepID=UPI0023BA2B7D|nr:kelch domain-containing protein 4-like isoform X1 [Hylaeus anthracinus]XP_054013468.1 kelch domain-containing protein 4-like isoform X1 [Hylaeus anthracinus]
MGKRDKSKKKVSGSVKTALRTEKKLNAKQKKELAALGEDDIEHVIAEIEKEEARRQRVVEKTVPQPSRRVNFTLTAHPFKDELIMLGGEFHDGRTTVVYGDMFTYNLSKNEWTVVKAPGAPPPRCGHQAIATATSKGELWVFGGEFSSPSESQFYHYKDLWVYRFGEKKWEKILSPGGPSARSGHRMTHIKRQLIVFGGFHDNLRDYKYYNDVYIFNLDTYVWHKIELSGIPPHPRSGCIILPTPENKLLVYGGYSKERLKKDVDKGLIHSDMFLMTPEKNDQTGLKWKWISIKQSGNKPSPRCSASAVLIQSNLAYLFGGVFDDEDNEEELNGTFYNDLVALDLDNFQWHTVALSGKKDVTVRRRRRKPKEDSGEENDSESEDKSDNEIQKSSIPAESTIIDDDGIFTVTIGPASTASTHKKENAHENVFVPCPRINPGLVVKHNVLYLYGGMFESGDRQYTLNDLYSLDCRKLDEWRTIIADDLSSQTWFESSSSSSEDENTDSGDEDESDCEIERMDVDEN